MKTLLLSALACGLTTSVLVASAHAQVPEGSVPSESTTELSFTGAPGVEAKAVLLSNSETEPSLVIFHKKSGDARYETILENSKLHLSLGGQPANEASLSVNQVGSLQIFSGSQTGPARYERTLTVAYRNGQYVIAGFTLTAQDSMTKKTETCDYNLLTGKGTRDGKDVTVTTSPLPLASLEDGPRLTTCNQW